MRKSLFLILGLALLAGGLTYALLTLYVNPAPAVVSKVDLAAGTRLEADLLEEAQLPQAAVPEGAYTTIEQAVGMVLTADRVRGDVITSYVAGDSASAAGIPAQLAPDTVAVAIQVDQATGLAGIVRAGQKVAVIAILDPQMIPQALNRDLMAENISSQAGNTASDELIATSQPTAPPTPTPTPQPPLSPVASITIHGLRVLMVPQSFRYEEVTSAGGEADLFASARTSQAAQSSSVILLEVPLSPMAIAPAYSVSPAELLALLNQVAIIHLVLEPAGGLSIEVASLAPVDLANLYEQISGYELNP